MAYDYKTFYPPKDKSISFSSDTVKRGDVFYINKGESEIIGSEQAAGRPAIIVSNDDNNKHSPTVEIVYLTAQPKNNIPTHTTIKGTPKVSTALCEQINTVSKDRLGSYICTCTQEEIDNLNDALLISLALNVKNQYESIDGEPNLEKLRQENIKACTERDLYKELYVSILDKALSLAQ